MSDISVLKSQIEAALHLEGSARSIDGVCTALAAALPADGVAVTVMTSDTRRDMVFASDSVIADFERTQYSLGEGPSLQAFSTGRPVLVPDIGGPDALGRWPALAKTLGESGLKGCCSFPMRFGAIGVGICTFYRTTVLPLTPSDLAFVLNALDLAALAMLELRNGPRGESLLGTWLAIDSTRRREVHQATGMLIVQLGVSVESAFARLRGYAFTAGVDIEIVAGDIVSRRLRLEPDPR